MSSQSARSERLMQPHQIYTDASKRGGVGLLAVSWMNWSASSSYLKRFPTLANQQEKTDGLFRSRVSPIQLRSRSDLRFSGDRTQRID
jgi:hypothetical protein